MSQPRLVLCSGAELPQDNEIAKGSKPIQLDTLGYDPNVKLRLENVTRKFSQEVSKRIVDLLELAAYIYSADCGTDRGTWQDDNSTESWNRDFHFVMPVRDIKFWQQKDVNQLLCYLLGFLSSDKFAFTFTPLKKGRDWQSYLQVGDIQDSEYYGIDRVVMFSGGLDSLAGAVESAHNGEKLVLVSHRPAAHISSRQTKLFEQLQKHCQRPAEHIQVWVNKTGQDAESTQRTRSFLFSALGVAVASMLKAGGVRFYENGVISLNWGISDQVQQSRASRTTHPAALRLMEEFHRLILESPNFAIDNPYIYKTKTEVVETILKCKAGELIGQSYSCSRSIYGRTTHLHCGGCNQCIDRRIAIISAGAEKYEPAKYYETDVFTGARKTGQEQRTAAGYARFALEIHEMTTDEIGGRYGRDLARAIRSFERQGEAANGFLDMHKRHGESVYKVLQSKIKKHATDLAAQRIPSSSLLAMVAGQTLSYDQQPVKQGRISTSPDVVLSVSDANHEAYLRGNQLSMPPRAFQLLVLLAKQAANSGGWVKRDAIYANLWAGVTDKDMVYDRQIDDTVKELRRSLDSVEPGIGKKLIKTKSRVGYCLQLESSKVALL